MFFLKWELFIATALGISLPMAISARPILNDGEVARFVNEFHICWSDEPDERFDAVGLKIGFTIGPGLLGPDQISLLSSQHESSIKTEAAFIIARENLLRCQYAGGYPRPDQEQELVVDVMVNLPHGPLRLR